MEEPLLDTDHLTTKNSGRPRDLLPFWIKFFIFLFPFISISSVSIFLLDAVGKHAQLTLYGLYTFRPFSLIGASICILFVIKGIVSLGLWIETQWAVRLALFDAILGILICVATMLPIHSAPGIARPDIRIELIALVPYLLKMNSIKDEWARRLPNE